jgi:hypothetical protein
MENQYSRRRMTLAGSVENLLRGAGAPSKSVVAIRISIANKAIALHALSFLARWQSAREQRERE